MRRIYRDGTVRVLKGGRWVPEARHKAILTPTITVTEEEPDESEAEDG